MKVENGFAVLSGVTVVTVTLFPSENILWIFSQPPLRAVNPIFRNLL